MHRRHPLLRGPALAAAISLFAIACAPGSPDSDPAPPSAGGESAAVVRVALFNVRELSLAKIDAVDDAGAGTDPQLRAAATIIQRVRPDVLVLNEIDHDLDALEEEGYAGSARRFAANYLASGESPIEYEHAWAEASNTGILSGLDLDRDGHVATDADRGTRTHGNDAWGYGVYPGQFSMAVLSRYPVDEVGVRTFRELLWADMPDNHLPVDFYGEATSAALRLSSKSHQDVPLLIDGARLHLLLAHPTPTVFDGDEDRNGRRNWDEIRLWADYLSDADWIVDDTGRRGGYGSAEPFLIVGDLNAQPEATESLYEGRPAIAQLLEHPRVNDPGVHVSAGAPAERPAATTRFGELGARVDYVLPSVGLEVVDGGVYWPDPQVDPAGAAVAEAASDHRLVWLELRMTER